MTKISEETFIRFLWLLGKSGLGEGYIEDIVLALLKIYQRQANETIYNN